MPPFRPLLGKLEAYIKESRRARLRHRTITIIAQDRVDRLAATTGWRPPHGVTGQGAPRHD